MSWWKVKRTSLVSYGASSHVGMVRSENQDAYGCFPGAESNHTEDQLFIVADGMGGHLGGKEASRIAIEEVPKVFFNEKSASMEDRLRRAFLEANASIFDKAKSGNGYDRMGTTCTAMALHDGQIFIAHVGDTRAYKINQDEVEQLTADHTLVEDLRREGVLTEDEARVHPRRNTLTRAMGVELQLDVDVFEAGKLKPENRYLLCSDGLSEVTTEELHQVVMELGPQKASEKLVEMANERGGHDNITVLILCAL